MEKIIIEANESVAEVVEKILSAKDADIVLIIPKNSALKGSVSNFHLIKHEAEASKKNVLIESVDEEVLALAHSSHLESLHPLLNTQHSTADIIEEEDFAPKKKAREGKVKVIVSEEGAYPEEIRKPSRRPSFSFPKMDFPAKKIIIAAAIVLVLAVGGWAAAAYLPRVTVVLTLKQTPWSISNNFEAKQDASLNASSSLLAAELFSQNKNITQFYDATGKSNVSQKATGVITIFNAYSSASQELVATTRFVTPDGKIYRLNNTTVVPGAQVVGGKITPSSISAPVTADKAGDSYNIGPVSHFSIPGFAGTARYNGFYGSSAQPMVGGFVGVKQVPTANDIAAAKQSIASALASVLSPNLFLSQLPTGFKIINGASTTTVDKIIVIPDTNSQGQFSVFAQGTVKALGFQENDIKDIFSSLWQSVAGYPAAARNLTLDYKLIKADFKNNQLDFQVNASATLVSAVSADDFKSQVTGKSEDDLRSFILGLPGVDKANISFWPFWVHGVPKDVNRVKIEIQ